MACPEWYLPETDGQLPSVTRGLAEFHGFIFNKAKSHILLHGDLKTWHGTIFRGVVPLAYYAGHYRSDDSQRPCLRRSVKVGNNPGAPFAEVPNLMRELSQEMRYMTGKTDRYIGYGPTPTDRARAAIQLAATYMGKFIRIHPFVNGNGRMARLTSNYTLHRYGYPMPFYTPYPRPGVDYEKVSEACMGGDFVPLYKYLLTLLGSQVS